MGGWAHGQTLDLSLNVLPELPDMIRALTRLKSLNLKGNKLTVIPDLDPLVMLTTVRDVDTWMTAVAHAR